MKVQEEHQKIKEYISCDMDKILFMRSWKPDSCLPKTWFYFFQSKPFENNGQYFSFLRYLGFFPDFIGLVEKLLDKKANCSFKIYDVIKKETNNCNAHLPSISSSKGNQTMKFD